MSDIGWGNDCIQFKLFHKPSVACLNWEGDGILNATLLYVTAIALEKLIQKTLNVVNLSCHMFYCDRCHQHMDRHFHIRWTLVDMVSCGLFVYMYVVYMYVLIHFDTCMF